jgi:hypothetical protein
MNTSARSSKARPGLKLTALAAAVALVALLLSACGDSGASNDELKEARLQGAAKAQQQAKITQIQRELRALRHGKAVPVDSGSGSAPAPAPESAAPESAASSGNCGGGLSANQYTTCGFAENVESDYYSEIGSGSGTVVSYSPTTRQTYSMYCSAGTPHECTGGNNAAVFFP